MAGGELTMNDQDRMIAEALQRDEPRLRSFIRRRVRDLQMQRTCCRTSSRS